MSTVDLAPKKQSFEVKTRRLRCLESRRSTFHRPLPSIQLDGVWLREAGFRMGDWARIIVSDGLLVICCERWEDCPEGR